MDGVEVIRFFQERQKYLGCGISGFVNNLFYYLNVMKYWY